MALPTHHGFSATRWLVGPGSTASSIRSAATLTLALACLLGLGFPPEVAEAKDKKRTVLMTEYDDVRVGAESSKSVAAQVGVLDDEGLNAYVSEIGHRLLRGVPRRSFQYEFSVVDQTEPNAFALPGGYIFISRGLLALANSEDELACVIGHEITHVAQRHSAAQQGLASRSMALGYMKAGQMAAYGRDMERDADKGGQILCAAAGYNPMGMSTFLRSLGNAERLRLGYTRGASFFDTHPGSVERAASNAVRASELRWRRNPEFGDTRVSLFEQINGLAVGQRPQAGVFVGDQFFHPDLDFQLRFPPGWRKSNTNMAVGAQEPRGEAVVYLSAEMPEGDPKEMAEAWVEKTRQEQKVDVKESKPVKIGHISSWRMKLEFGGRGGHISSYVTFIPYRNTTWSITGITPSRTERKFLGQTLATARSFRPMNQEERESISGTRLRFVKARRGESLAALGVRSKSVWNVPDAAIYNAVFIDHRFEGGEQVKIAVPEAYRPGAPARAPED